MSAIDDSWKDRSYQDLMDEAVRLELTHANLSSDEAELVLARLEDFVMTCSFVRRPGFTEFANFFRDMCRPARMHPLTVDAFLRAAWKACDDEAKGIRPIPGKAEVEMRARDFRRTLILDTEESWAYEGLHVQFRSDLEEGEDPVSVALSYAQPSSLSNAKISEGMREHIESGGLQAYFAEVVASFEALQRSKAKTE